MQKLTLEQAEMIAIENNNQVNGVRELLKKAKEGRLESISKWLPKIDAFSTAFAASKDQFFSNSKSAFLTQLALTQSIFSSEVYYNIKISTLVEEQLRLLLNAAIIDVLYQTRVAYYQVILDMENIHAAEDKIELLAFLSKKMEDRYEIGTSILYNVNQSKVAIANATTDYYESIKQRKVDLDSLATVLGYDPGDVTITFAKVEIPVQDIPELKEKLEKLQPVLNENTMNLGKRIFKEEYPESEQRVMQKLYSRYEIKSYEDRALKYQPTLKVYENQVNIAKKEVSKSLGEYIPKVGFSFNFGGAPTNLIELPSSKFTNQTFQWGAGVTLNWLVFDSFGRERRVRQARYQKNAKYYKYRKQTQDTFASVRKSVFEIEESASNFLTATSNVKLAEQTIKLANDQLEVGYGTIFDYQITVDGLIQAVNTKNKSRYDLLKAYYSLIHATGEDLMNHQEVKCDKSKL
ncbi:MAG: hypothetical protein S4CHLAM37_12670 [Chlamydiia bacterium]|nr:hypothetical protein [Chlamydiia bacterium]